MLALPPAKLNVQQSKSDMIGLFFVVSIFLSTNSFSQTHWPSILTDKPLICLGEETHGIQSYYDAKWQIIKKIDQVSEAPLILLVESPLLPSILATLRNQSSDYHYHHTNLPSNIESFSRYTNFGFDLQEDCRYLAFADFLVEQKYVTENDKDLLQMNAILSLCILGPNYQKDVLTAAEVKALRKAIDNLGDKVLPQIGTKKERQLLSLCFENRAYLAAYLGIPLKYGRKDRIRYRDSIMANNVERLYQLHQNYTPIVWAANLHIGAKGIMGKKWTEDQVKSMAEHLEQRLPVYRIAITNKRKKKQAHFFDHLVLAKAVLVGPKYLELNCK